MTPQAATDTSVAVPLLVSTSDAHSAVSAWARGRQLHLCGHALIETYSVLTRLPGDLRVQPADAVRLIEANFDVPLILDEATSAAAVRLLAELGIAGGAVYDGLVALTAARHKLPLATRDARALPTYRSLGADPLLLP